MWVLRSSRRAGTSWAIALFLILAIPCASSDKAWADHLRFDSEPSSGSSSTDVTLTSDDPCPMGGSPPNNSVRIYFVTPKGNTVGGRSAPLRADGSWKVEGIRHWDDGPGEYTIYVRCYYLADLAGNIGTSREDHKYVTGLFVVKTSTIPSGASTNHRSPVTPGPGAKTSPGGPQGVESSLGSSAHSTAPSVHPPTPTPSPVAAAKASEARVGFVSILAGIALGILALSLWLWRRARTTIDQ